MKYSKISTKDKLSAGVKKYFCYGIYFAMKNYDCQIKNGNIHLNLYSALGLLFQGEFTNIKRKVRISQIHSSASIFGGINIYLGYVAYKLILICFEN